MAKTDAPKILGLVAAGLAGAALAIAIREVPAADAGDILQFTGALLGSGLGVGGAFLAIQWQMKSGQRSAREHLARITDNVAHDAAAILLDLDPASRGEALAIYDIVHDRVQAIAWAREQLADPELQRAAGYVFALQELRRTLLRGIDGLWEISFRRELAEGLEEAYFRRLGEEQPVARKVRDLAVLASAALRD